MLGMSPERTRASSVRLYAAYCRSCQKSWHEMREMVLAPLDPENGISDASGNTDGLIRRDGHTG
jgi:hypothetical protein